MELLNQLLIRNNITKERVQNLSPLVLAYVGDAIFEIFVRTHLIGNGEVKVGQLHKKSIAFVKAKSQAEFVRNIADDLTAEEAEIIRRGRNIRPASPPKNADIMDYRYATGFEALIGYLYLKGSHERLLEILELIITKKQS